jgi:aryl-alcohol dehydrogenase-like predicted oxidoreductase/histidinol phosphatase-like enzyme/predicted kinase
MPLRPRIGLGAMRLSTERDRDESRAIAVLQAAFDAGLTLIDTADAYCWDETERGHNERLIARAIAAWSGDRALVEVATKGGLRRPGGRWEPDGRAKYLVEACEQSLEALGVDRIDLYQLHAFDPRTPLSTSMRALANLKRRGLIEAIGLCNVTVGQIEEARRIAEIDSIQVELSIWQDQHVLSGVAEYCTENRLRLLAHRPLGGPQRRRKTQSDPTLAVIAARHGATPFEIALAWLMDLSELIVPLPGATRVETATSIARAGGIALTGQDRDELDRAFPAGRVFRDPAPVRGGRPRPGGGSKGPPYTLAAAGEMVLVMGLPAAGKSTFARSLVEQGYHRLNRDEAGGTLARLLPALDAALGAGASRVVIDNTYVSRKSRAAVIGAASARGVPVRCVWLSTSLEEAQTNAVWRIVSRYGRLPGDRELESLRKSDVAAFLPTVQFRYRRDLEAPDPREGFTRIDTVAFERRIDPTLVNRAVILSCDGILARSRSGLRVPLTPEDVEVVPGRADVLRRYRDAGALLLGISWQPEIAEGAQSSDGVKAVVARMCELLDVEIEVEYCPHAAGPPTCWCRKPLPGLGVVLGHRHRLDPAQCIYVGSGPQDPGFARRLGWTYRDARQFFDESEQPRR